MLSDSQNINLSNETLELRFFGSNISPNSFRAKEVGEIFTNIELALTSYIFANNAEIDTTDLFISPIAISNESLGIKFSPNVAKYIVSAFLSISTAIETNSVKQLPIKTIESLQGLQKIVRSKNCNAEFKHNGLKVADFTPNTAIEIEAKDFIVGETIIYGTVQRAGGIKPTVWLVLDDNKKVIIQVNKDQAKKLSQRLYEEVGFRGIATWSKEGYHLVQFKVSDFISDYEPTSIKESFDEVRNIIGKYWDNIDDINGALLRD